MQFYTSLMFMAAMMKTTFGLTTSDCVCTGVTDPLGGGECRSKLTDGSTFCYVKPGVCPDEQVQSGTGDWVWGGLPTVWTLSKVACGARMPECPITPPQGPCHKVVECSYGRSGLCLSSGPSLRAVCGGPGGQWQLKPTDNCQGAGGQGLCCLKNWWRSILSCCWSPESEGWLSRLGGQCPHNKDDISLDGSQEYKEALATLDLPKECSLRGYQLFPKIPGALPLNSRVLGDHQAYAILLGSPNGHQPTLLWPGFPLPGPVVPWLRLQPYL